MIRALVTAGPIDAGEELARLEALGGGGVASFTGVVRGGDGVTALELEQYPGMTQAAIEGIAHAAAERWPLLGVTLIHRHGRLETGERIVFVGAAARHRAEALAAAAFLIDWAKTRAPFWKREWLADGSSRWIEPRPEDETSAAEWEASAEHGRP